MGEIISGLLGGLSVALFTYVKFNGRVVRLETLVKRIDSSVTDIKRKIDKHPPGCYLKTAGEG